MGVRGLGHCLLNGKLLKWRQRRVSETQDGRVFTTGFDCDSPTWSPCLPTAMHQLGRVKTPHSPKVSHAPPFHWPDQSAWKMFQGSLHGLSYVVWSLWLQATESGLLDWLCQMETCCLRNMPRPTKRSGLSFRRALSLERHTKTQSLTLP